MMPGSHVARLLLGKENPKAMAVGGKGTNKGNEILNPQAMAVRLNRDKPGVKKSQGTLSLH